MPDSLPALGFLEGGCVQQIQYNAIDAHLRVLDALSIIGVMTTVGSLPALLCAIGSAAADVIAVDDVAIGRLPVGGSGAAGLEGGRGRVNPASVLTIRVLPAFLHT